MSLNPHDNKNRVNGAQRSQVLDFDYVGCSTDVLFAKLNTTEKGLSEKEANSRLEAYGYNEPAKRKKRTAAHVNPVKKAITVTTPKGMMKWSPSLTIKLL